MITNVIYCGEFPMKQSELISDHALCLKVLQAATCNLEIPPLSPCLPPLFYMSANNKESDEVAVRGNVYHEIGCVIFRICDARHREGYQCNPSYH